MWHGYYRLPLIRCYKKDEFKQRFTDFRTELGKNTEITICKGLEKPTISVLQRQRRKIERTWHSKTF